jgi:hypothetical protein
MHSSNHLLIKGIAVIALVLLIIAGLYYYYADSYTSRYLQARLSALLAKPMPPDIAHASYLLTDTNGGGTLTDTMLDYRYYNKDGSLVEDLARAGGTEARLIFHPDTRNTDLEVNGETILSSPGVIEQLTLSPDGKQVLVAETPRGPSLPPPSSWNISLIDTATWQKRNLGTGFAALFLDDQNVAVFGYTTLSVLNLSTMSSSTPVRDTILGTTFAAARSEDGKEIGWSQKQGDVGVTKVYSVSSSNGAVDLTPLATFDVAFSSFVLEDGMLYGARYGKEGPTSLWQYPLDGSTTPSVLRTFPSILGIRKIVPFP